MSDDLDQICKTLDKLTLDSLTLMEKHIQCKLDLESAMAEGESNLAKARYIMGQNSVSQIQLPTEESNEFKSTSVVNPSESLDIIRTDYYDFEVRKQVDGEVLQNPTKWFGILVPQNLHSARENFKKALHWAVTCTNMQIQLYDTMSAYGKLLALKNTIIVEK